METAVFVKIASENNCGGRKELKNSKIIHTLERGMWYDGSMNRRRVSISGFLLSFFPLLYDFSPERCRSVRKSTNVAVPCVGAFLLWQNWDCAVLRGAIFSLRPPVAISFAVRFLPAALLFQRPSGTPSFDARRKIGEKGVSRGCGPLNPRSNVLGHSDVLCACCFATVHLTRLSRLRRCRLSPCLCVLRPEGEASASP